MKFFVRKGSRSLSDRTRMAVVNFTPLTNDYVAGPFDDHHKAFDWLQREESRRVSILHLWQFIGWFSILALISLSIPQ